MWLVQAHVRVRVDPHAADAFPAVDQDDLLIAGQVAAGDEEGIDSGKAGSHDADVTALYPRRGLDWGDVANRRDVLRCDNRWLD